jgi:hypothetical protein
MTSRPHDSALRWFAGIAVAVFLSVVLLYWLAPVTRRALYREHGVVEWATALLFLGGAVIGGDRLRRLGAGWRDARWLIPISSLVAMLDEVNWVVFALGVRPPVVLGKRFDALHDIAEIGVMWSRHHAPRWALVVLGAVLAAAVLAAVATAPRWWPVLKGSPPWRFFMLAVAFGVVSQGLDIEASGRFAQALEEVLELGGALALCFSAWLLPRHQR